MCCFAVCGLADTDLMVHIVASRLHISQSLVRQRHHFGPNRIFEQQPSTGKFVRVLESQIKQRRMDPNFYISDNQKTASTSYPCNHTLIDVLNAHFMISVCWVLV